MSSLLESSRYHIYAIYSPSFFYEVQLQVLDSLATQAIAIRAYSLFPSAKRYNIESIKFRLFP